MRIVKTYRSDIMRYCRENNLSIDKVFSSGTSETDKWVFLQYADLDSDRAKLGLLDNEPAPITLKIYLENGKLRFEQTDLTRKYLGAEKEMLATPLRPLARPVRPSVRRRDFAYA